MFGKRPLAWILVWALIFSLFPPLPPLGADARPAAALPPVSATDLTFVGPPAPAEPWPLSQPLTHTVVLPLVASGYELPLDSDGDGLPDLYEDGNGNGILEPELGETDPYDPDCDDDGLSDGQEIQAYGCDPWAPETDGDTLLDYTEALTTHTHPAHADTDADGRRDDAEDVDADGSLDPGETDPNLPDTDDDGLLDGEEVLPGNDGYITDPRTPDTDADTLSDADEAAAGTDPTLPDPDADGLSDPEEISPGADGYVTNPHAADSDADGLNDGQEAAAGSDPLVADSDADGLSDYEEAILYGSDPTLPDTDADTLSDYVEVLTTTTNPAQADTDADTLPDAWEVHYGLDPLTPDAGADPDADGRTNAQELAAGTDPSRPDSDEDGLNDGDEVTAGTDPLDLDSDDDTLADGAEVTAGSDPLDVDSDDDGLLDALEPGWNADLDGDGTISALDLDADGDTLPDADEDANLDGNLDPGETAPGKADTDDDSMPDPWELANGLDPQSPADRDGDPDADGLPNRLEFTAGSDPHVADTDTDGLPDGLEVGLGLDPTDAADAAADLDADLVANLDEYNAGTGLDNPDSDADTIIDGQEPSWSLDTDGDGAINALDTDSDADRLDDGAEVFDYGTDPLVRDTDADGIDDGDEVLDYGTDPLNPDSDHDAVPDGAELAAGIDPLDADSDDDTLWDGEELVSGWNGAAAEGEDLGTPYQDPVFGNWGARHDGSGLILTWTLNDVPPGHYRVGLRARRQGNPGDVVSLSVQAGGAPVTTSFQLLGLIYRWHSSDAFTLVTTGTVIITLTDPQAPPPATSVIVDRIMLAGREAEPVYYTTWATLADTDGDGLRDGLETAPEGLWIEAEHYATVAGLVADDVEGSNSKLVRNQTPGQVLAIVPEGHVLDSLTTPPPWTYQVFVRARRNPALDANANVQVSVRLPSQPAPLTAPLQRLTDRLEWQLVPILLTVQPGDTLRITVTAQTVAGQAIDVDKLLVAPIWFEGQVAAVAAGDPLGNGEGIHLDPRVNVLVVDDDANLPDLRAYYAGALDLLGLGYDVWDVASQGNPSAADLGDYALVVWFTGAASSSTFTAANEAAAGAYLAAGGHLFLSSTDYLTERGLTPFGQNYLHVGPFLSNVNLEDLQGAAADPIGDGLGPYHLLAPTGWTGSLRTDAAEPDWAPGSSSPFFWMGATYLAGTDYDNGTFKTVFFSWPLEGLADPADRAEVLGRIATWAGVSAVGTDAIVSILQDQPSGFVDPLDADTDGDGYRQYNGFLPGSAGYLTDSHEQAIGTNPFDIDTDGDADLYPADAILDDYGGPDTNGDCKPEGAPDGHPDWTDDTDCNPLSLDTDNDEVLDWDDPIANDDDIDNDGLKDGNEDTNLDGLWTPPRETHLGTITTTHCITLPNPARDTDGDGLTDGLERGRATPQGGNTNPVCFDGDTETRSTTDPLNPDSDGDGLWDGGVNPNAPGGIGEDADGDGACDEDETDPRVADTDHDGLVDGAEVLTYLTFPLVPDSDDDLLTDGQEVLEVGSSPIYTDTDTDGFTDYEESFYAGYAISPTLHPPVVTLSTAYLLDADDPQDEGWVKVGHSLISTGTVLVGGQQSGGGRRLTAANWHRAMARLDNAHEYRIEINGTVVITEGMPNFSGSGTVDVIIDETQRIRLIDGRFSFDEDTKQLSGELCPSVGLGEYGMVTLSGLVSATVDVRTGEISGNGQISLTPMPGLATVLEGHFAVHPAALKLSFAGDVGLLAGGYTIPLKGAEAEIDFANGYFAGKTWVDFPTPDLPPFLVSGPKAEFSLDIESGHLLFNVQTGAELSLVIGPITMTLGEGGPGFAFEIDTQSGYFYLQISNIDLDVVTINDVEIEIDPGGGIEFDPRVAVPGYPSDPFTGHFRLAGDVSIMLPVAASEQHKPEERWARWHRRHQPELVGLMLNLQGEHVIRAPSADDFLWATNSNLGIELSAKQASLGITIGGTTCIFDLGGDDPLIAIGVGQDGMALKDLGLGLPDAFGNFYPQPGQTVAFAYYLAREQLAGAATYNYLGLEAAVDFVLDVPHGLAVTGTLDVPLGGLEVDVTGRIDWDGNILATGQADLTWLDLTVAAAWFTLDNAGLRAAGTLDIPGVGSAVVGGQIDSDGTFLITGTATLHPAGWEMASAAVTWTNTELSFSGDIHAGPIDAAVAGTATATSFRLTGSGSLSMGSFTIASASITVDSTSGLYAQGSLNLPNLGSASLSGSFETNGHYLLAGSGTLAPGGFTLLSVSFSLEGGPGKWATLTASGMLVLANVTVAGTFTISSDGSFSGSGSISWGGLDVSVSVSVTSGGLISVSGSISVDATYNGYGIKGSLALAASTSGEVSGNIDFEAVIGGVTVFSGSASASSNGKVRFRACALICVTVTIYL